MNALLAALVLATYLGVAYFFSDGPTAVLACAAFAVTAGLVINRHGGDDREFLLRVFVAALLVRIAAGTSIYMLRLQLFFGGDAITYHENASLLIKWWQEGLDWGSFRYVLEPALGQNGGMIYYVSGLYWLTGPNMLAVQYVNSVVGAATAPVIFLCALHIFRNTRVARLSAYFVAFYPSLVLWSSQGLKDGPIVFLLALVMLATLRLGERWSVPWLLVMVGALFGLLSLRFYVFYMAVAAVLGAFLVGMTRHSAQTLARQVLLVLCIGLALTYLGVLRTATRQLDTFADLERIQTSRADLAVSAQSGFGRDIDVSTSSGALSAIPVGVVYLLFAPFPWQLANLRQSITLPEMLVWWASFPLLVLGAYFTVLDVLAEVLLEVEELVDTLPLDDELVEVPPPKLDEEEVVDTLPLDEVVETPPVEVEVEPPLVEVEPPLVLVETPLLVETPPVLVETPPVLVETPLLVELPPVLVELPPVLVEPPLVEVELPPPVEVLVDAVKMALPLEPPKKPPLKKPPPKPPPKPPLPPITVTPPLPVLPAIGGSGGSGMGMAAPG